MSQFKQLKKSGADQEAAAEASLKAIQAIKNASSPVKDPFTGLVSMPATQHEKPQSAREEFSARQVAIFTYPYKTPSKEHALYNKYRKTLEQVSGGDDCLSIEPTPAEKSLASIIAEVNFPGVDRNSKDMRALVVKDILNSAYDDQITATEKLVLSKELAKKLFPGDSSLEAVQEVRDKWARLCVSPDGIVPRGSSGTLEDGSLLAREFQVAHTTYLQTVQS